MKLVIRKITLFVAAVGVIVVGSSSAPKPSDYDLGRNMETMVNLMRELSLRYVDEVDMDKLTEDAAEGMMRSLDPYTTFIPEREMKDFQVMATGKYGGIGSLVRKKGDYVILAQPYRGFPADKAGLKIGDKILKVNGESIKGMSVSDVSTRLRGKPGSTVSIEVERIADGRTEKVGVRREVVSISGVNFSTMLGNGIGYIQHSDFTDGSYEDMRRAIESLQREGELKGLVLDYRDNGGGLLQEAIKTLSLFVEKGTRVVDIKGRGESLKGSYKTELDPLLPTTPIVVLVNSNTASAAEIVSGALQDLDRGVLLGQQTFGKGLVQSTVPLDYNTMLKVTTSKYYMPSGRCIQAIDYSDSGKPKYIPDSVARAFYTRNGRKVLESGGIKPDVKLPVKYRSRFAVTLFALGYVEDFADEYYRKHSSQPVDLRTFAITDADFAAFVEFMRDKDVPYESSTRLALKQIKEAAKSDLYSDMLSGEIEAIESRLKDDKQTNLKLYERDLRELIEMEVALRYGYKEGVSQNGLRRDEDLTRAVELLGDKVQYEGLLASPTVQSEPLPMPEPQLPSAAAEK